MSSVETILRRYPGFETDAGKQDRLWQDLVWEVFTKQQVTFDEQKALFDRVFSARPKEAGPPFVYWPTKERMAASNLWREMRRQGVEEYRAFHRWSRTERERFWARTIEALGVRFMTPPRRVLDDARGPEDPSWLPGAEMNIVDSCFRADDASTAIVVGREGTDEVEHVSIRALRRLVDQVAAGLRARGFAQGDHIALYMPMDVACVAAYLGCIKAGLTVVSIADSFSAPELRTRLAIGEAKAIIVTASYRRGGKTIDLFNKVREAEAPMAIVLPRADAPVDLREGDILWDDLLVATDAIEAVRCAPYETTNVLFSSGTTGTPKAIPWTHLTPIKAAADAYYHQDVQAGDVVAWPTNIGWMMGPWLIYAALMNRATIALYEGAPHTAGFCRFVAKAGVTMLGLVPALVRAWRNEGHAEGTDWSRVKTFSSTGESSALEDYLWLMSRTHYLSPVIEYCGGTEIGGGHITGTVVQPASPATFSTPAVGLDIVILDERGAEVPDGGRGEIFLVPPSIGLSQRLLNRDHHEEYYAGCPPGPKGKVLRRHGDEVERLHRGFYRAHGRADDTMNLGGIKVSSLELERVVDGHDVVYQSAAVAVRPEGGGADLLVLFLVPRPEAKPEVEALRAELQKRLRSELNPLYKIHDVVLVGSLPRTASNKIMRRELRAGYGAPRVETRPQ